MEPYPLKDIKAVQVPDSSSYPVSMFILPEWAKPYLECVLIPHGMLNDRIEKMAEEIYQAYHDQTELTFLVVMSGSDRFFNVLLTALQSFMAATHSKLRFAFEYVKVSSYVGSKSGALQMENLHVENIKGKHVVVVEDIYDSGKTMKHMLEYLAELGPKSVRTAVLLHKRNPANLTYHYQCDFTGFVIPDKFVVGYHLDYNQKFRELPHLCVVNKDGIAAFK